MIRLDKLLCHAGYGTRKEVKKLIRAKLVMINGEIAKKDDMKVDEMNLHDYVMWTFEAMCDLNEGRLLSLNYFFLRNYAVSAIT